MKKIISTICAVLLLLSVLPIGVLAVERETKEFEGKTYINVNSKAVIDEIVAEMIENRSDFTYVYYIDGQQDWEERYPMNVLNFTTIKSSAIHDYWSYSVNSVGSSIYPIYTDSGFTEESYGYIEVRYLDNKEELANADAIIDKKLSEIASMSRYEKIKYIADLVCASTEYGSVQLPGGGYDAINGVYDVLTGVRTNTVCTSYALTFQRFMERAKIPCFMTSNDNHIWNMVELDGKWYGVDCTNDIGAAIDPASFLMGSDSLARYPKGKLDPVGTFAKQYPISKTDYGDKAPVSSKPEVNSKPAVSSTPAISSKPTPSSKVEDNSSEVISSEMASSEIEQSSPSVPAVEEIKAELSETTSVKAELFKSAAELKVPLVLAAENYSWSFDLSDADDTAAKDFDAAIYAGQDMEKEQIKVIEKAAKTDLVYPFSFAHHGQLPAKATVSIRIADEYANKTVDVYSLNENNEPILELTTTVSSDAVLKFETSHCSLWYISEAQVKEKGSTMLWLWIAIAVAALAAAAFVTVIVVKRVKSK